MTALALIRDVVDMADGLYDLGGTDGPTLLAPVRMDEVLEGALLQREHARGHIFVLLGTDIAGRGLDLQGYKHAVLSAGWRLDHLCLAATGAGLTASPTGGFPPLVLKERLARLGLCFDPIVGFVAGGAA